jgi:hypothetical protein
MSNKSKKKSTLIEIRDILKGELDKFIAINNEIIDNQNDFKNINENYEKYNNSIDEGRDHITKLKKREFYENLFVWIGFCIFMLCVTYILLRRFPIHKIFIYIYKLGKKIVNFFIRLFILSSSDKKNLNKNEL